MLLKVLFVLALLVATQARSTPQKEEQKLRKQRQDAINAASQSDDRPLLDDDSRNQPSEAEQDTSNSNNEVEEVASKGDETPLADLDSDKLTENDESKIRQNEEALIDENEINDESKSEKFANEDEIDAPVGGSRSNAVHDTEEAEVDGCGVVLREDDECGESSVDHEDDEVVNDDDDGNDEENNEKNSGVDDVSNENDELMQDDDVKMNDENEDSGKNNHKIVTAIEKTLSEEQSVDKYLDYLEKRAEELEEIRRDLGKNSVDRKVETDRSKRESAKIPNDRSGPLNQNVPKEVVGNAVQSLNNGDRLSRYLEPKPVQRQACSQNSTAAPVSPETSMEPLTKEEQQLQKVIDLRKQHEANVAKEQDEVVKAEHMAHTLQEDLQEVMNEIRQLKKEIKTERIEADAIGAEVKADQKELEEHDQLMYNARRKVDALYMKLSELESSDCEARSKRQLARHMTAMGLKRLDLYETPRHRFLRELREKELEQGKIERMMDNRRALEKLDLELQSQRTASEVQEAQKQLRELQRAKVQENGREKIDDLAQSQQQDGQEAKDEYIMEPNELVQRSVDAQAQAQGQAPAPVTAMPRQASSECTTAKGADSRQDQYNAILQEIIIGEAKVKIESIEVDRAEQELASSRKRLSTAMSQLGALVMELKNLQARAINAGDRAKKAHMVLAYHDQLLFNERRKVIEAQNLETDLQKQISDLKTKVSGKCTKEPK